MKRDVDLSQLAVDRGDRARAGAVPPPRRHLVTRYALPAALVLGAFGLVGWAAYDLAFPPRPVTVVPVFSTQSEVQEGGTPLFMAAGWVEPRPTPVRVAALAQGVVEELLVVEDQPVEAGQPVAELVKDDARLARERAQADLRLREAELQVAAATWAAARTRFDYPVHLEAELAEAEARLAEVKTDVANLPFEIRRAESNLTYAQRNYEGKTSAGEGVTGRALEEARSQYESSRALLEELRGRTALLAEHAAALARRRDAVQRRLELLADERQARDEAEASVRAAEARADQARVALAEAELQLERMTIRAAVPGRVLHLVAPPGTRVGSGPGHRESHDASTVVTLYRPEQLQVRVDVRFEDLPRVGLGQAVAITSPAVASPLVGEVLFLSSEADIQKNTLQVKVAVDAAPGVLKPEMLVEATFLARESRGAERTSDRLRLFIPERLVVDNDGGKAVWVADQSAGVARRTPIRLGAARVDGLAEVVEGLDAASRLIASGGEALRDNQRIRVTGEAAGTGLSTRSE